MKIVLATKASGQNYSIEAGIADGEKNFDHHGSMSGNPSPCNDSRIKRITEDSIIEITHTDSDTLLGVMRLLGLTLPDLDLQEIERIDNKGSSGASNDSEALAYMVWVMKVVKESGIPRPGTEPQDVTAIVMSIINSISDKDKTVGVGKASIVKSENDYQTAVKKSPKNNIEIIYCKSDADIDPSRPYKDGKDIVVFYREIFKSISLYANPSSKVDFLKEPVYAGITFAGHPKACGSPRGKDFTWEDTVSVGMHIFDKFKSF